MWVKKSPLFPPLSRFFFSSKCESLFDVILEKMDVGLPLPPLSGLRQKFPTFIVALLFLSYSDLLRRGSGLRTDDAGEGGALVVCLGCSPSPAQPA